MSMPEADAQLPLKKRARRRLIGAIAIAVFAAVVLPMVMDQAPQAPVADVEIRIPGQEERMAPLVPKVPAAPAAKADDTPATSPAKPSAEVRPADKPVDKVAEKTPEKAAEKPAAKPAAKPVEKAAERPTGNADDAKRAAAILAGKAPEAATPPHVILIGAFTNPGNVKVLQSKLGELGIKVYTEILESPQGRKTRVRAGPFATREAAEKALERMKRIGVNGVVAIKQ